MPDQKILVIDDSPDIHELVQLGLFGEPIELISCFGGEDGLAVAALRRPDLILLDVEMTGVDGFEVCRRLKANPMTTDAPIIFITGASSTAEKLRGLELGAIDYVTKPFDPAELRARVRAALNTRRLMGLLADKADQLSFQATHDFLTRLPNRAMFSDHLEKAVAASVRTGKSVAVLLVDVDRFKHVNDTYGHQAGDEMLCQITQRLRARLRASDVLARMGGDEFAAILCDLTSPDDAIRVATSLAQEFQEPIGLMGRKQFVTISIGSAAYPRDAIDIRTLVKNADLALYQAKDAGRNTVRAFIPAMNDATAGLELEGELRLAIKNREFRLHYQPKVDRNDRITGLEALIRWQHPRLGIIPPGRFIPLAEDTGLIIPIGTWVIEEASRQSVAWIAAGLGRMPIAVNVSTLQFGQPDFIRVISDAIGIQGSQQPCLQIELTETLLMRNIGDAGDKLAQLRKMNVSIAIDDFGIGYSSLAYLQRLPLDTLKIDRSFVSTIKEDDGTKRDGGSGRIIVKAIVALAKSLGLQLVAEGVETILQREFLLQIGCDQLQGFLFCPPNTPEHIELLLRRQADLDASRLARCA
jgi:diguanylate cyclase (GGDEF)-like protein